MIGSAENVKALWERVYDSWGTDVTDADRITWLPIMEGDDLDQLKQLATPTYDGNLISKQSRSNLVDKGLVDRWNGLNFCNRNGYCALMLLGVIRDTDIFKGGHAAAGEAMTPADSQALPPMDVTAEDLRRADEYCDRFMAGQGRSNATMKARELCRERQLAHALKINRLILRDSLTHKYGRNPTEEEMQFWMKIWSDQAGVKE